MKKRRNCTEQEKGFVRLISGRARQQDIADALGRAKGCVEQLQYRLGCGQGYRGGPRADLLKIGPKATAEAWRRFQAGEYIDFDVLACWIEPEQAGPGSHWRQWQVDTLYDLLGTVPLTKIGAAIGKTRDSVRGRIAQDNRWREVHQHCCRRLAKRLGICHSNVLDLFHFHRVRGYYEGKGYLCIHRDDAEWLIENYWKVNTRDIPTNPGAFEGEIPDTAKKAKSVEAYSKNLQRERAA